MSIFSPARRFDDVDGRSWELYAYKVKLRDYIEPDPLDDEGFGNPRLGVAFGVLDAVLWLLLLIPKLIALGVRTGWDAWKARASDEWTIEAVTFEPRRTSYTWTTTTEYRGNVLAQVEAGIAAGEIPRPRYATFIGTDV